MTYCSHARKRRLVTLGCMVPIISSEYLLTSCCALDLVSDKQGVFVPLLRSRERDLEIFGERITEPGIHVLRCFETPKLLQGAWNM